MAKILSNIQERIERSIFEAIRNVLVDNGYLPDITNFYADGAGSGKTEWDAALAEVAAEKGFCIMLYNSAGLQERGLLKTPRIVMQTRRFIPTDVGYNQSPTFIEDPNDPTKFLKHELPARSLYMVVEISLVSSKGVQDRVMHQILGAALGSRSYLGYYDSPCDKFFIEQHSYFDSINPDQGIMTKLYSYKVDNIELYDGDIDTVNKIAKIADITISPTIVENISDTPEDRGITQDDSDIVIETTP